MASIREAVIVAYGRTIYAKAKKGSFRDLHPVEFGAQCLKGILAKVPQLDPLKIDDVIVGCALPQGMQGWNMARQIVQRAGLPDDLTAQTVTRFCSSGLQTIAQAAHAIMCGQEDVIVAGGVETMTKVSMELEPANLDPWLAENAPANYIPMGITAENVAERFGITRQDMEAMAVESHRRAAAAQEAGYFADQIIPVSGVDTEGTEIMATRDEGIRPDTSIESLAALKPCFKSDGLVTAGTSSQMSDGAAFVVLMSREKAEALGCKPIARFISFATGGVPAEIMGIGPVVAVPKALNKVGLALQDMDVVELNEAFASQALYCIRALNMDERKVNPMGGAMALGHPLGATGTMLVCMALSYLARTGGRYGLVTMCIGGGQGAAGIFEMVHQPGAFGR